jgi:hypothetical protein
MSHCFCKGVSKLKLAATRATTRLVVRDQREEGLIDQLAAVGCIDGKPVPLGQIVGAQSTGIVQGNAFPAIEADAAEIGVARYLA